MGTTQCDSVLRALHALAHLRTLDVPSDYVVRPDFDRTGVANRPSRGNLVCLTRASLDGQLHGVGVIFSHGGDEGPNRFFVRLPPIQGSPPPLFVIETQQSRCQPPQMFAETKQVGDESWFNSRKHY